MDKKQEPKYDAVASKDGETYLINRASGEAIPDDEPVFIFRARDIHAATIIEAYVSKCFSARHRVEVIKRLADFEQFALDHPERMKEPDTEAEK